LLRELNTDFNVRVSSQVHIPFNLGQKVDGEGREFGASEKSSYPGCFVEDSGGSATLYKNT